MRFKTKFSDYMSTGVKTGNYFPRPEEINDTVWHKIMTTYPDHPKSWEKIYLDVMDDFYKNYGCEVTVKIFKKEKLCIV